MPIASGFGQDPNPNYLVRKPGKTEFLDESIYYKQDTPFAKPVEVINRPIIRETVFLPDRKAPPLASNRNKYTGSPGPTSTVYPGTTTTNAPPESGFNLVRALGLNADCPCWSWILIVFGILLLLGLIGMCLYFILDREGRT